LNYNYLKNIISYYILFSVFKYSFIYSFSYLNCMIFIYNNFLIIETLKNQNYLLILLYFFSCIFFFNLS